MDNSTLQELNRAPFGRDLHILAHRLPRSCKLGRDWELERGFQISVLGEEYFEFILGPREMKQGTPPSLVSRDFQDDEERFLIWHVPGRYDPGKLEEFRDMLAARPDIHIGLILSRSDERTRALTDYPRYRAMWSKLEQPVLQVFQKIPEAQYFSVEKSLFQLGRVGRRLIRLGKYRRLLPW